MFTTDRQSWPADPDAQANALGQTRALPDRLAQGRSYNDGDHSWDNDTAEALMLSYEADDSGEGDYFTRVAAAGDSLNSLGTRYTDVSERIKRTLTEVRPSGTSQMIKERLDALHTHVMQALDNMARRSDVESLGLVQAQVNDLGQKLDHLEHQVARIGVLEGDMRTALERVSDERFQELLDYSSRLGADLEAVALRAAEIAQARFAHDPARVDGEAGRYAQLCQLIENAAQNRFAQDAESDEIDAFRHVEIKRLVEGLAQDRRGHDTAQAETDARRHDELRQLIEGSIHERRVSEAHVLSLMMALKGNLGDQTDRQTEIKLQLEASVEEHRQSEQTLFVVLDTLQQAMVGMLDRIDAMEAQQAAASSETGASHKSEHADAGQDLETTEDLAASDAPLNGAAEFSSLGVPVFGEDADGPAHAPVETKADIEAEAVEIARTPSEPEPIPAPENEPNFAAPRAKDAAQAPMAQIRRDFIAEARRAKLKAAANRAEALASPIEVAAPELSHPLQGILIKGLRLPHALSGADRLLGTTSTTVLVCILAVVVAINGTLLLVSRKSAPAAHLPAAQTSTDLPAVSDGAKRSDLEGEAGTFANPKAEPASGSYGLHDDIVTPTPVEEEALGEPVGAPLGTTIASHPMADSEVADAYQRQILAGFSGKLGTVVAETPTGALMPDANGRVRAAYVPPDGAAPASVSREQTLANLPPATVGPLSLRMAAANGDPSAQFEVAARLAEGTGTNQDFEEALRWYQRSAAQGFAQSQYRLGTLYERGLGVSVDLGRARVWYQRAAEKGNVKSMHNLAVLAAGDATKPDYALAGQWFTQAAEYGLGDSQYNLGVLYENGLGVEADRVAAYKWYALAAKSGDQDAAERLAGLKSRLSADERARGDGLAASFRRRASNLIANDARTAGEDWKKRVGNDTNG